MRCDFSAAPEKLVEDIDTQIASRMVPNRENYPCGASGWHIQPTHRQSRCFKAINTNPEFLWFADVSRLSSFIPRSSAPANPFTCQLCLRISKKSVSPCPRSRRRFIRIEFQLSNALKPSQKHLKTVPLLENRG